MEKNLKAVITNSALSTVLIGIGLLTNGLSAVLLFALVPVFIVLKDSIANDKGPLVYSVVLGSSLALGSLFGFLLNGSSFNYLLLIYPLGIALTTSLYWVVKRNLNSNLGVITLIIYWLTFEYIALLINPEFGDYFIFGALSKLPSINVSSSIGFLGYTLWALASNLILSFVLYDSSNPFKVRLRVLSLIYAAAFITLPLWLSFFWNIDAESITRTLMIKNYSGVEITNIDYQNKGEWLGRTSAWVAVLLTIYALVKKKITK